MKIKCPNCGALKAITAKQAESEKPIYCDECKTEMHEKGYPLKKGDPC